MAEHKLRVELPRMVTIPLVASISKVSRSKRPGSFSKRREGRRGGMMRSIKAKTALVLNAGAVLRAYDGNALVNASSKRQIVDIFIVVFIIILLALFFCFGETAQLIGLVLCAIVCLCIIIWVCIQASDAND